MSSSRQSGGAAIELASPAEVRVRRALISVSDKSGVLELAKGLAELGVEIVSTGGTARELASAGMQVRAIEDFTGFPEMMDGRVKTLHPRLYAGLLARRDEPSHLEAAAAHAIEQVDLVCVNLYPFEQTVAREGVSDAEAIENIDVGGPTMVRAAAKNHDFAAIVVDPADYPRVLAELRERDGRLSLPTRRALAGKAFALTARYDTAIAAWFAAGAGAADEAAAERSLPPQRTLSYEKALDLRYGENPHQRGAYYAEVGASDHLLAGVTQLHGKELSFNNLLDLSAARELVFDFEQPACAIVKHNNPCGCALGQDAAHAYGRALACDPASAFGGVIALNRRVDRASAEEIGKQFVEVLLAPGFEADALELLREKKNVRLLRLDGAPVAPPALESKPVIGGILLQDRDAAVEGREQMRVTSKREPDEREWQDMLFAWRICMRVRSNAIVIARDGATVGIGAGQMSRVDAVKIAVAKGGELQPELLAGAALASDAYFPFPDGPEAALQAGVSAIVQPGGSVRDELTIEAVDAAGAAMVATGIRHFKH
ncbi:MAG: bifunctional phosphoribosylaminoimidazolecarboxamide formyltransferase/IMP cyclohydrolase [Solirubrobacteraceae bacterium]